MVGEIRILTDNIIHKIAAGEVIERPASVIKELVENSIDAKSTRISIELQAGGTQLITVSDDGIGMTRKDVEICAHRHATSKISNHSELFNNNNLGFRGEALASIGAI